MNARIENTFLKDGEEILWTGGPPHGVMFRKLARIIHGRPQIE